MKFVFIGSSGRSGTTLLQKMLVGHSQITGGPEFDYLYHLLTVYRDMSKPYQLDRQSFFYNENELKENWKNFLNTLITHNVDVNKYTYFSEKTPTDILVSTELMELFPDSKVIYMYRDGRDAVNSFVQVEKRAKAKEGFKIHGNPKGFAELWNICGRKFQELKANPKYNGRIHAVCYEDLVNTPEKVIAEVMNFLGLQLEAKQLEADHDESKQLHIVDNVWYTKSMYTQNAGAQNVQKWKKGLNLYQKVVYQTIMARQLKAYNYPVSGFYIFLNTFFRSIYYKLKGIKPTT